MDGLGTDYCTGPLNPRLASIESRSSKIGAPTQRAEVVLFIVEDVALRGRPLKYAPTAG